MKALEKIIDSLYDNFDSIVIGEDYVTSRYESESVEVIVFVYEGGKVDTEVYNLLHDERNYSNVEQYISSCMPSFYELITIQRKEVENDFWQSHGFANESDYTRWRYGA